jgi:hypothetical protein
VNNPAVGLKTEEDKMMTRYHTFKKGDVVTVFQCGPAKGLEIEGNALIVSVIENMDERYMVRFYRKSNGKLERETYERFIDRDGQANPTAYMREFNAKCGFNEDEEGEKKGPTADGC